MKIPRDLSAQDLIKALSKYGYYPTRQKGSHIRLTRISETGSHHISIPNHDPLKLGTLSSIIQDVSRHLKIDKDELLKNL